MTDPDKSPADQSPEDQLAAGQSGDQPSAEPESSFALPPSSVLRALRAKTDAELGVALDGDSRAFDAPGSGGGRYQVREEIGRGGVGVVFLGRDVDLGRDVAMKVLRREYASNPEVLARFVEEAQVGGQLQHPGIVPVYELGLQADDQPYFAMKLIKGETLAAQIASRSSLTDDRRRLLGVFEQVCQTLAYAHTRRVVHRDLKPANVMIGAFGEVQVVDWGFAKVLGRDTETNPEPGAETLSTIETIRSKEGSGSQSMVGAVMGTPAYMPPEQALGDIERLDARSDVFGLGAILCEILTGAPPYLESDGEVLLLAARGKLDNARARLAACGAEEALVELCTDCLSPDPEARPADGSVVAERIGAWISAVEDRAREAEVRAAEARVRARATLMLSAAALLIVGLAAGGYYWYESDQRARTAQAERLVADALEGAARHATEARAAREPEQVLAAWGLALAAVDQATHLAASDHVGSAMLQRVQSTRAELEQDRHESTAGIEQARRDAALRLALHRALVSPEDDIGMLDLQDRESLRVHREYTAAFADYRDGKKVQDSTVEEVVADIRAGALAIESAAAFDRWTVVRLESGLDDDLTGRLARIARTLDPDSAWRSRLREMIKDPKANRDALVELARTADIETLSVTSVDLLASGLRIAEAFDAGIALLVRALDLNPGEFSLAFQLGMMRELTAPKDWNGAVSAYRIAVAVRPELNNVWHRLGYTLQSAGRLQESLSVFRTLVARHPENAHWQRHLAMCLGASGLTQEAVTVMERSLQLDPDDPLAVNAMGQLLLSKHEFDRAVEFLERAIAMNAGGKIDAAPTINLANYYQRTGKPGKAARLYRKALELDETAAIAHYNLGVASLLEGKFEDAIEKLERALEHDPRLTASYATLASALDQSGHELEARVRVQQVLAMRSGSTDPDPDLALAFDRYGMTLGGLGRIEDALRIFRHAVAADPGLPSAHFNIAATQFNRGQYAESVAEFERAEVEFTRMVAETGDAEAELWIKRCADAAAQARVEAERQQGYLALARGESASDSVIERVKGAWNANALGEFETAVQAYLTLEKEQGDRFAELQAYFSAACAASQAILAVEDDEVRAEYRGHAKRWLDAEAEVLVQAAGSFFGGGAKAQLARWFDESSLAPVRDAEWLDRLPAEEALAWHALWIRVAEACGRTR